MAQVPYPAERYGNPSAGNLLQLAFAIALMILGVIVAIEGLKKLFFDKEEKAAA